MRFSAISCLRSLNTQLLTNANRQEQFVPKHLPVEDEDVKRLEDFLHNKPNIVVLTGAGISTESGIPDYRSAGVGLYARAGVNRQPIQYQEFLKSAQVRKRYWARNYVGWPRFSSHQPNAVHHTLARFEREGRIQSLITQNVDRLHTKAGSRQVLELHGSGYTVMCMSCDYRIDRHQFQDLLSSMNPNWGADALDDMVRPDGDVEVPIDYVYRFRLPSCPHCKGFLKPEIIFFGDNVPRHRLLRIEDMIQRSDGLLVLGSSLLVFSGYRIVLQAKELELPVAIVNIGETRADHLADIKLSAKCGDVIPRLFDLKRK